MNEVTITVGAYLFQFDSHEDWVRSAQDRFRASGYSSSQTICVDAKGRVCLSGREFGRARDEGTFPVKVYDALNDRVNQV